MNVIRWVGSKRHSAIRIVEKFNTLPELPKRYFEPMCGGMSVAILYDHPNTFVNDINYDLINQIVIDIINESIRVVVQDSDTHSAAHWLKVTLR